MRGALQDGGLTPADVDYVNAHGTSTPLNDSNEAKAIATVFGEHAKRISVSSTKSMTGHMLGAAGGLEFIAATLAIRDQVIPPTINHFTPDPDCGDMDFTPNQAKKREVRAILSNSAGFGGHNVTIAVKRYQE
jgi:3-oxoacyl-[acyl-carrier-protein] synthase II